MNKKAFLGLGLVGLVLVVFVYIKAFTSNTQFAESEKYIFIPTGATYEEVIKIMTPEVDDIENFKLIAEKRSYDQNVFPGRFLLKKGMGSFQIVTALRHNTPLELSFNNQEVLEKLVSRVAGQIEADSVSLMRVIQDPVFLKKNGLTSDNVLGIFIPNTYEIKWNIGAEKFRDKMLEEYHKFWNSDRMKKAKSLGLTPEQVITLASIVHKESVKEDERPRVAGVYLNRLKLEMPLQADPTIIFAIKKNTKDFDQVIKRVKGDMLFVNSPYNTYKNVGLPPGPIAMPDISAVDAVLSPEKHDYIYFCASVDRKGYHDFAVTYEEHQANAKKYAEWVNKLGL
ncbi:endolytic transglycosylase MltG [Flavobacterium columnare]|uniref:Endolytic murein transglycosylase n=1 Tax=Flavobacterium columnare TaxID=996 RepID=A0AAI8GCA0_9FLAO|nr:endolytic transglycosylase MltG [Flavobacterium columnare]AMO21364.1 endolytic transglycosylase MltG [Flavobacterium columnare]AUX19408.1 aminodeoxychorismate lyase [Flavobacterium columnare]MEB3799692.1 endolytic transglycosylase MltG [Flavobacterium columnare]OOB81880.1 aminodeoxychorismate lyase [Flavobacterium columnare]QOG58487.1 endolytic transglycosylase MltG [Flavobacterium columnare]